MPAHKPEELHELFAQALNSGDLDTLVALYEPQVCLEHQPGKWLLVHRPSEKR
jgi:hypothetical protein